MISVLYVTVSAVTPALAISSRISRASSGRDGVALAKAVISVLYVTVSAVTPALAISRRISRASSGRDGVALA